MYIKTQGLVLRETIYKESSKILTVLTSTHGKITVSARGARRRGSKLAAATQLLAYSEMTLYEGRVGWILTEAFCIEQFHGLREDLASLALGSYFAELLERLSDEDEPNPMVLSMGLNALYAVSENKRSPALVKAAFEMRMMCIAGFEPMLDCCGICEESAAGPCLSIEGGILHCVDCRNGDTGMSMPIGAGGLDALRHIISADPKRIFSFTLSEAGEKLLAEVCQRYVEIHLDTNFKTLDFYKSLL